MNSMEDWHKIGSVNDFEYNKIKIIKIGNIEVGVIKIKDNQFRIIKNSCPHKMGPICKGTISGTSIPSDPGEFKYDFEGQILRRPWHRYEYNLLTGEIMFNDLKLRLKLYEHKIENNVIYVKID